MTKANEHHIADPGRRLPAVAAWWPVVSTWTARLAAVGMEPREAMLLRHVALADSQQTVATLIGLPASRIVGIVDRLEARGWIERRTQGGDRRRRDLYLTPLGREALETIMAVGRDHEKEFTRGLSSNSGTS